MDPFLCLLPIVSFDQPASGTGESRPNRSHGQTGLSRDLGVAETRVPKE